MKEITRFLLLGLLPLALRGVLLAQDAAAPMRLSSPPPSATPTPTPARRPTSTTEAKPSPTPSLTAAPVAIPTPTPTPERSPTAAPKSEPELAPPAPASSGRVINEPAVRAVEPVKPFSPRAATPRTEAAPTRTPTPGPTAPPRNDQRRETTA